MTTTNNYVQSRFRFNEYLFFAKDLFWLFSDSHLNLTPFYFHCTIHYHIDDRISKLLHILTWFSQNGRWIRHVKTERHRNIIPRNHRRNVSSFMDAKSTSERQKRTSTRTFSNERFYGTFKAAGWKYGRRKCFMRNVFVPRGSALFFVLLLSSSRAFAHVGNSPSVLISEDVAI